MTTITKSNSVTPIPNSNEIADEDVSNSNQKDPLEKGLTQRKAFEKFIPHVFVLRKKGCSWNQITALLNDTCGFKLKFTTVRFYYGQMVRTQSDICQDAMAEYISKLNSIEKKQEE
ncbi:hypothetical protein [Undibacterium sp.]|uniref:hypothetical protein n=1 Tax=Undibacterium sp. TaxID=1914977 RepID=UPI0025E31639|nr:hypothetical protein [Undibacterium sp.]